MRYSLLCSGTLGVPRDTKGAKRLYLIRVQTAISRSQVQPGNEILEALPRLNKKRFYEQLFTGIGW
jgi:hypothetical protein